MFSTDKQIKLNIFMIECTHLELVVLLILDLFQKLSDIIYKLTGILNKLNSS